MNAEDQKRIEEIGARARAATEGEWGSYLGSGINQCTMIGAMQPDGERIIFIADLLPDWVLKAPKHNVDVPEDHIPNMKFIEKAREDILWLIDRLKVGT